MALLLTLGASAATAQMAAEGAFQKLISAVQARSLEQFTSLGDEGFKAMPKSEFDDLVAKFAPMLSSGYRASYLGEFKQKDTIIHYWKLTFPSDPNDWLAIIGIRGGKIRGFVIQRA